ncbi:MAG TPA: EAL domain-containing protein [Dermatophilaceae bacterium]|nr:EAL domain-containing protein [Dermatophilaceae bacterium]
MNDTTGLHRTLIRQLEQLDLGRESSPSQAAWRSLLDAVSTTYTEADDERFTLRRSADVSTREMHFLHEDLSRQTLQDTLTGLPNRAALIRHLDQSLEACARAGEGLAVLYIDLDGFKRVNDSLGHAVGDELLVLASQRIRACIRPDDVLARLGSDEFVVVCPNVSDSAIAPSIAARIGSQLSAPFPIGHHEAVVSASIGLVTTADAATTAEHLLGQADLAMYEAKASGKARAAVFDNSMQEAVDTKFSVRNALGRAIAGHELRVLYQPIVSLDDERVIGAEALVRWERPGFGLLSPAEFVPIAEEGSLISALDCWVLQEAVRRGAQWCDAGGLLAVNLSARTLQQEDVVRALSQALNRSAISPGQLTLEITETTLLDGVGVMNHNLDRLRELGVQLSIDDFGTGHSSLSQLQQTDVDILKIDQSFISQMDQDGSSAAIVSAIITLGHALGLTLVAEGVARPAQAALLREQGCDSAQGWLFGQPLSPEEIDRAFGVTFPELSAV